jgi:hypothetical protein
MIDRRCFLGTLLAMPAAQASRPLEESHFPDRLHQFVWRNWELANLDRMAEAVKARPRDLESVGRRMGLPPKPVLTPGQQRRIYITVIRQNWHLLPREQLLALLGWSGERLDYTLKEDDFLDVKLGPKPDCPAVVYSTPSEEARKRAGQIRRAVAPLLKEPGEPPFAFIPRLSAPASAQPPPASQPRIVYSYFALYGDPLLEPSLDPFPDGYLDRLAAAGVNGVWMQAVLPTLASDRRFPEFGRRGEERLDNLARLAERLKRRGVGLYLYLNEPRSQPAAFYARRQHLRGAESRGFYAMCSAQPEVREWLESAVHRVFTAAPALAGLFTITMSENLTNCFSGFHPETCPRCRNRKSWDGVGEVLAALHKGLRAASPDARFIVWDWGWPDDLSENLIPKLPKDARPMSVSEWSQPVERGGVKTRVGEYSISVVGPGPRATANWKRARDAGLRPMAKVQFNNTWEISAVPYIPVAYLVAEHCRNLAGAGVEGMLASWTLGGYPSPNLEIAREFSINPRISVDAAVEAVAVRRFGTAKASAAMKAWRGFSQAFQEFPYGVGVYFIPTQHGPANLLRPRATGVPASMILFPQDDIKRWSGAYPPTVARDQFRKLAVRWEPALETYREAAAGEDLAIAEACGLHFRSTANQFEFYLLRDGSGDRPRMRALAEDEITCAEKLCGLARRHSVLGYEASNHYYYRPADLAEKVLNCRYLLEHAL